MVYERFRTGKASARLTWMGGTTGPQRRGPVAATGPAVQGTRWSASPQDKSSRAGASLGQQDCCDIPARPSFALPGSTPVIPPATAADLPNRQGPCLQNSSGCTPAHLLKRLFPAVTLFAEKLDIRPYMGSNDAGKSAPGTAYTTPGSGGTSRRHVVKRSDRRYRCVLLTHRRRQVLDRHRQMVGGRPGRPGVMHVVRPHRGDERPGHPERRRYAAGPRARRRRRPGDGRP